MNRRRARRKVASGALMVVGALVSPGCAGPAPGQGSSVSRPNVLLLTIDTLRLERMTCYGGPAGNTPRIDAIAAAGVRFASVQAPRGLTWPSLTSLMTGMYPRTHQVRLNGSTLEERFVTLPELLQEAGYETGGFLANMCDAANRGLDTFFCAWWEETGRPVGREKRRWDSHDQPKWDRAITRETESFIRQPRDRPFFAWVHYLDPHKPYDPVDAFLRDEYDGSFPPDTEALDRRTLDEIPMTPAEKVQLLAAYDSQVAAVDAHIGHLLDVLDELELADDTLVIVTADHGEELGEHNFYLYHLASVYQQVLSVPWVLRWPGQLPAGRVVSDDVENIDIAPTVLALLGLELPEGMEGVSREPLIRGEPEARGADYTYAEWQAQMVIVGHGPWRFIWNPREVVTQGKPFSQREDRGFVIAPCELYNLEFDPLQQNNLIADRAEVAESLLQRACRFVTEKPFQRTHARVPEAVQQRLRALGYVQNTMTGPNNTGGIARFCNSASIERSCQGGS